MLESNYNRFPKPALPTAENGVETPTIDQKNKSSFDGLNNKIKSIYNPRLGALSKTISDDRKITEGSGFDTKNKLSNGFDGENKLSQKGNGPGVGTIANAAVGVASFLATENSSKGSGAPSDKKNAANALGAAAQGASIGMSVAGPYGAAVGAVLFGGYSLAKSAGGKAKYVRKMEKAELEKENRTIAEREVNQRIQEGQDRIAAQQMLYKAQLGIIS